MPDEREMDEIHDAMKPQESATVPRAERRRVARDQSTYQDRFTGIKRCGWCHFELELEREPVPEHCPACGQPYDLGAPEIDPTDDGDSLSRSVARRHASAVESVAGAIELVGEGINRLADVFGDIGEAIAQRIGKAGR